MKPACPVNLSSLDRAAVSFKTSAPFNHCVVDDFLLPAVATQVAQEFPDFESPQWYCYKNALEDKKALNDWNAFPPATYSLLDHLNSPAFVSRMSRLLGLPLQADPGLHGGGWHMHGPGGNLNPHLDYSIHPKLGLARKLNIIIYLSRELRSEHGGHLGLWSANAEGAPGELMAEIEPRFNRAVLFDTTQQSWHGMSRGLVQPEGIYRKSLAVYYLCEPPKGCDPRKRALFAARDEQKGDQAVLDLIRKRADLRQSRAVYRT